MFSIISDELINHLHGIMQFLKRELVKYSLNKINICLIEDIKIIYYGVTHRLNQIATINIENQSVIIRPFDKINLVVICNEINKLNIDLNSFIYEDSVKVIYPKVTVDRRNLFIKKVKEIGEDAKINIRNIRRDYNNKIKKMNKEHAFSQDDEKRLLNFIQSKIDEYIKKTDDIILQKIEELKKI